MCCHGVFELAVVVVIDGMRCYCVIHLEFCGDVGMCPVRTTNTLCREGVFEVASRAIHGTVSCNEASRSSSRDISRGTV